MKATRKTVLVVDDGDDAREAVRAILETRGFRVVEASSGKAAVAYLEKNPPPAAILLDLIMPGMTGWDFLEWRHERQRTAEVPVIVISAASAGKETVALTPGGDVNVGFVEKPVDVGRLLEALDAATAAPPVEATRGKHEGVDFTAVLRQLVDTVKDYAICLLDPTGQVTTWNAGAERLKGYEAHEIIGRHVSTFYTHKDVESGVCAANLESAARDDGFAGEGWRTRKGGSRFWAHVVITALRDADRNLMGFGVVTGDVTERRKTEEDLNALFELSRDMLCTAGFDGRFKRLNAAWTAILGHSREELLAHPYLDFVHPEDRERTITEAANLSTGLGVVSFENRYRCKDGSYRWLQWNSTPLPELRQIYCVARDVTERKVLDEQLRQTQKMEAIGRLAGGVAHDFNNLLTAINGYGELALDRLRPQDPLRPLLEEIKRAGRRAATLTHQLLAFSRKQVLQARVVSVNGIVDGLLEMLRRLIPESVTIVSSLEARPGNVNADPGQLEQVLMNLAINARDAMPQGGTITIATEDVLLDEAHAAAHAGVAPGRYVMLAVTDTGHGIDKATLAHVFEPFFSTKSEKGTGLGLATVYGIVKQSGGQVAVESEVGRGTTFRIYLPRADGEATPHDTGTAGRAARGTETVLLVEDEVTVRDLVRTVLDSYGYEVLDAVDGGHALRVLMDASLEVHLLVTDMVMPAMSGRELAEKARAVRPELNVLFMSGYSEDMLRGDALGQGNGDFLQKPFAAAALAAKVREVLDRRPNVNAATGSPRA